MGGGMAYFPQHLKRNKKFVNRILKLDYFVGTWGRKVTFFLSSGVDVRVRFPIENVKFSLVSPIREKNGHLML